ncbi:MAG: phage shock envelope stress response protein PspM [Sciscionella sp.]
MSRLRGRLPDELLQFVGRQMQGAASSEVRRRRLARTEPRAKLERQQRRIRSWLACVLVVLAIFAVVGTFGLIGLSSGGQLNGVLAPAIMVALSGTLAVRAGTQLRSVNRKLDAAPPRLLGLAVSARERLPSVGSAAREPMQRLRECETSFAELLRQLWSDNGSGPVPRDAVRDAAAAADDAAAAVRKLADQLRAVEGARNAAPTSERAQLAAAVRELRARLDDGVQGYGRLVAAAGRVVAASASPDAHAGLTDATDNLQGLASALQELSDRSRITDL